MRGTVALIGLSGAGKSTVGPLLAESLRLPFVDVDAEVERDHGSIADLFARHGEAHFRGVERAATLAALGRPAVVSLGGGAPMTPAVADALADVQVVWLTVSAAEAAGRVGQDPRRPLLGGAAAADRLAAMLADREATYRRLADIAVETSGRPPADIVSDIVAALRPKGES